MRKQKLTRAIIFIVAVACFAMVGNRKVSAANMETIPLEIVDEIDNVPYPSLTYINLYGSAARSYSKFTVNSIGQLKVTLRSGVGTSGKGNVWISRDSEGMDTIGNVAEITAQNSDVSWFLESGTYYVNYTWSQGTIKAGVAIQFEEATTEELVVNSNFNNSNPIKLNSTTIGFVTTQTPNDYYSFVLDKKANLIVEYSFDGANNSPNTIGNCSLYDENQIYLHGASYKQTDKGISSFNYLLEPGTYYIKLNNLFGYTSLNIKPMYYDIELISENSDKWTDEPIKIKIDTSISYSEIRVVKKDVEIESIKDDSIWAVNGASNVKVDGKKFEADESAIYSVRIKDIYGVYSLEKIEVKNIDIEEAEVTGVENNEAYDKAVTIKWSDTQSGIDTSKTTLNDKVVKSGTTIKEQGKYVLKVYDKIGNLQEVTFYVDSTAPTSGIENGKTYDSTVTLKFSDKHSGVKKILVNDEEVSSDTKNRRYYLDGEYVVEMWDNADNYRKQVFYIK